MKVSKTQALNSVTSPEYFFPTRTDRNSVFSGDDLESGTIIAVADDPNVNMDDMDTPLWSIELFNGVNWVLESLDPNYSLTVTDVGLNALANMRTGEYVFDISCIKVKTGNIVNPSTPLTNWTNSDFIRAGDVVLDTSLGDESFSLTNHKTLTWRNSLGNSGMQFTLLVDSDTVGYLNGARVEDYTIGAVGLYVKDQNTEQGGEGILFAIGNLSEPIQKYATNATRVGNAVKLYFNLVLSNLGHVANITSTPEDFHSLPEIETEEKLEERTAVNDTTVYPYNAYLIDNFQGSNAPALALRTLETTEINSGGVPMYTWKWTYLTANDDKISVDPDKFDPSCKNYMIVSWDATSGKFVPSDGDRILETNVGASTVSSVLTGIKINNSICFAGNIRNFLYGYRYYIELSPTFRGADYVTGDILTYEQSGKTFFCSVTNVVDPLYSIDSISDVTPSGGNDAISSGGYVPWHCDRRGDWDTDNYPQENVARIKLTSEYVSNTNVIWTFPSGRASEHYVDWLNKPLYVDIDHTSDSAAEWNSYCATAGFDASTEPRDRRGKLTIVETEGFIGWCTGVGEGNSSVKLALDLRNEASYAEYGTTRYADNNETKNVSGNSGVSEITSVCPKNLQQNYVQKTLVGGNPGESASNPVVIDTHTKFTKQIVSTVSGVGFSGTAYRAQWGDLAEYYESDEIYPAGTLITMGSGMKEITIASVECNGVVSDKPGYILGEKKTDNHLPIALVGKVPVIFDNRCVPHFGDRVYLSRFEDGKASNEVSGFCLGKVIDKRPNLENHRDNVLCSIRISF